jgi:uncharacterized protein YfaQ (DUF2300 family)
MVVLLFTALVEQVVQVVVVATVQDQQDHVDQAEVVAELKTAHAVDTQEALVVLAT